MTRILFRKKYKEEKPLSLGSLTWKRFLKQKMGVISLAFILLMILIAILGYLITPDQTPYCNEQHLEISLQKPGFKSAFIQFKSENVAQKQNWIQVMLFGKRVENRILPVQSYEMAVDSVHVLLYGGTNKESIPLAELDAKNPVFNRTYHLGTDRYGRDVVSQLLMGTRISLAVGAISVFIALTIGVLLGSIAGYYGGKVDQLIVWFINVVWSIPTLLLVIAISFALGKGFWQIFIAMGLTMWVDVARVVRGQVLAYKEQEFVEAGKALGYSGLHIIFKHILPNLTGTLIVLSASNFSSAILMEAGLSFLGLGIQPPTPSWGMMMKENYAYIVLDHAYLAIVPGIAIMLLVLAFMLTGSALRNAMDVRSK